MPVIDQEHRLTRYLLGELKKEERAEIEDNYLADSDSFDQLLVAEDQLIDDYLRGHLSANDRSLFEENFLTSSERRNRLKSARALMTFADKHSRLKHREKESFWLRLRRSLGVETPIARLVLVTGFLIALIGGPLALYRITRLTAELESMRQNQAAQREKTGDLEQALISQNEAFKQSLAKERRERGRLEQELESVREGISAANQSAPPPVVFALGPGSADGFPRGTGSDIPTVAIPKRGQRIQLRFDVADDESRSYLAVVTDDRSNEVWRGDVRSKSGSIKLTLSARLFSSGTYRAIISDSDGSLGFERYFAFTVERK